MAFPQTLLGVKVELFYDGVWNALPPGSVRGLGAEDGEIQIGLRGQPDESSGIVTTSAQLSINNKLGRYSPRNLASDLYGKIGANTPIRISADVDRLIAISDAFAVAGTNGWPTSPSGHSYTMSGGSTSDYSVAGGLAFQSHAATNVEHVSTVANLISTDHEVLLSGIKMEAAPTAGVVEVYVRTRENGTSFVQSRLSFKPDGTVDLAFDYSFGTPNLNFITTTVPAVSTTDTLNMRISMIDDVQRCRVWKVGTTEPSTWNTTCSGLTMPTGMISIRSKLGATVSNALPFDVTFTDFAVTLGIILAWLEVAEWPQKWDSTGNDVWVPLTANGITRRLQQNAKPLRSALYRWMRRRDLTQYFSFENMKGASDAYATIPSDLEGGAPFIVNDTFGILGGGAYNSVNKWSDEDTLVGSDPLPTIQRGQVGNSLVISNANVLPTDLTDDSFSISFWDFGLLNTDTTFLSQSFVAVVFIPADA